MTTIEKAELSAQALESVLLSGDLSKLSPADRMGYYQAVCNSLGLNPLTKPFDYITLNGRLQLYALKAATDQLRAKHQVSIVITNKEMVDNIYVVTAMATMPDGQTATDDGAVAVAGLQGEAHANALMKTVTKAKRRVTLSISGLGMLDESEAETIPGARTQAVDIATGELANNPATQGRWAESDDPAHNKSVPTPSRPNNRPETPIKGGGAGEVASGSGEDGDDPHVICPIHHVPWETKTNGTSGETFQSHYEPLMVDVIGKPYCNFSWADKTYPHLFNVTMPEPPPEIDFEVDDEPEPQQQPDEAVF